MVTRAYFRAVLTALVAGLSCPVHAQATFPPTVIYPRDDLGDLIKFLDEHTIAVDGRRMAEHHAAMEPVAQLAGGREEPACERERKARQQLWAALNRTQYFNDPPPGVLLRISMTDPRWPGTQGWRKFSYYMEISWLDGNGLSHLGNIELHYVYNQHTRQWDDVKFKNTVADGCVGSTPI